MPEQTRIDPEFDESRDGEERAATVLDEAGGLPDDNPFTEVVQDLRDDGASWQEVYDHLAAVESVVDEVALEAEWDLVPEWRVAVRVPDEQATSGERYKYQTRTAPTVEEAEKRAKQATGYPVDPDESEQVGVAKVA